MHPLNLLAGLSPLRAPLTVFARLNVRGWAVVVVALILCFAMNVLLAWIANGGAS